MDLQNITDTITVGEMVMHWYNGECLISEVIGKGFSENKHALIVLVNNKEVFVTKII